MGGQAEFTAAGAGLWARPVAQGADCRRRGGRPDVHAMSLWQRADKEAAMPVAERIASLPPGRLESHHAREDPVAGDPEVCRVYLEFVHAHGLPKGPFTTFSTGSATERREAVIQ